MVYVGIGSIIEPDVDGTNIVAIPEEKDGGYSPKKMKEINDIETDHLLGEVLQMMGGWKIV